MSRQTRVSPQEDHEIAARSAVRADKLSLFRDRLDDDLHDAGMELSSVRLGEHDKRSWAGLILHPSRSSSYSCLFEDLARVRTLGLGNVCGRPLSHNFT